MVLTGSSSVTLVPDLGIRADHLRLRAHDADELSPLLERYLATSSTCSRSAGQSSRGSPTAATSTSRARRVFGAEARVRRHRVGRPLRPARDRARRRRRPLDARVPRRRLRRGRDRGRARTVLRLHPQLAPVKAAVLPLVRKDGQPELAREIYEALRRGCRPNTTWRRDRSPLSPPGRDRHSVGGHDRPPVARGPTRSRSATATRSPRTGWRSTRSPRNWSAGCRRPGLAEARRRRLTAPAAPRSPDRCAPMAITTRTETIPMADGGGIDAYVAIP